MSPWVYKLTYEAVAAFSYCFVTSCFSYRCEGKKNVPRTGPLLIVANHQSWFDPFLIGVAMPRAIRFMARRTLFTNNPALGRFMTSVNIIPVNQEGFAREGLRLTRERLEAGDAVLIFPEGARTWDGNIDKLMPGVTLLIRQTGADVLPVGIAGAWDAWPRWRWIPTMSPLFLPPNKATIAVSIGKPINGKQLAATERHEILGVLSKEIHAMWEKAKKLKRK
jgi:1-acyl-sn-glycerol-3-phosphate acyltransferase